MELLTEKYKQEFVPHRGWVPFSKERFWFCERKFPEYPVKTQDGRELGTFFMRAELRHIYFDEERRIKWPDDFIDPYPVVAIDCVEFRKDNSIRVDVEERFDLGFLSEAYYAVGTVTRLEKLKTREERMKVARIIPAVIKDIEVFLKYLKESLEKYKIEVDFSNLEYRSEELEPLVATSKDGFYEVLLDLDVLDFSIKFSTKGMSDEEIIDNIMKLTDPPMEYRRKFRKEWLPSEERRNCYESTFLYPEDPFREKHYYILDRRNGKILVIDVYKNKISRFKFPLERIEFLKEEFPDLWEK
ncbi:MAG: hypothetical protein ACP5LN_09945 [Thermoproteota archaeon]